MENGKIRHPNHMIDARAIQFLQNFFPVEWVARTIQPDYGLDLDVELFDYENEKCITLGEHIFLQVKGTEHPSYSKSQLYGPDNEAAAFESVGKEIDVINYSLEVSMLNLVERMGSSLPVLLVMVDLQNSKAYFICLNDYIRYVLPYQAPNYKSQEHVTIHIPIENALSVDALRWYGKRVKLCSLMQEMLAVHDDCFHSSEIDVVDSVNALITRNQENDAWNARHYWSFMSLLYEKMQEMILNGMYDREAEQYVCQCAENPEDWKNFVFSNEFKEYTETGLRIAQKQSCGMFLELCSAMLGEFENNARHFWLPTYFGWGISHSE